MKVYTYSQARQKLSDVLNQSKSEDVLIRRRTGETFRVSVEPRKGSPLDIEGVDAGVGMEVVLDAIRESRSRHG